MANRMMGGQENNTAAVMVFGAAGGLAEYGINQAAGAVTRSLDDIYAASAHHNATAIQAVINSADPDQARQKEGGKRKGSGFGVWG